VERLDAAAAESSDPWNNAGTGHSALCELNYTPQQPDGSIDITKAVNVNEEFQISRQFWAYAVENGVLTDVRGFLNPIPHASWVQGAEQVDFMRRRREALADNPLFETIELVDDRDEFARRLPLMSAGRSFAEPVALNWAPHGTVVDFGNLSKQLIAYGAQHGVEALFGHEVGDLKRERDGTWTVKIRNNRTGQRRTLNAKFVFVGAGGSALRLIQKSGIPEVKGFGGFPVSGKFLRSDSPDLAAAHRAKVYGFPAAGAPPMSAPHLDARLINGKSWLLFGPFAGWSPKFLKQGHLTDLPRSVKPNNLKELLSVGMTEMNLVRYLLGQLLLDDDDRIDALREFVPTATSSDWQTIVAGQRVQVIRPENGKGVLGFDTTAVVAADGSIAGLLGASPGASTAVHDVLQVMQQCFSNRYESWLPKLKEMVPSLGTKLSDEPRLYEEVWDWGTRVLGLDPAVGDERLREEHRDRA
jgi:malate dehydrogenase (quinone)